MTRKEFARIVAYIATATDKELPEKRLEVYFDLLGDLDFEVMMTAAKRVVLEHPWATFPSVAELRSAAALSVRAMATNVTPIEAWEMACKFGSKYDPERSGAYYANGKSYANQFEFLTEKFPAVVVKAIKAFGPLSLSVGKEPIGVLRSQFVDTFEQIVAAEERAAILPPALKTQIEAGPKKALPAKVSKVMAAIGKSPDEPK